jgi:3-hydroxyisobutyrate dehydrogenase-like beta-hydroxyacid dehydrogenase
MTNGRTVAVLGTGDMGSAVGASLARAGFRVLTDLSRRGAHSRSLAARAGLTDVGSLAAVVREADVLLSIVPPSAARSFAADVAAELRAARKPLVFVDCNAVAPATVRAIARLFDGTPAAFVDAGIVGPAPRPSRPPTRFYASGPERAALLALATPEVATIDVGDEIGAASALKMTYAALNKGVDALYTAVLLAAERLGIRAPLMKELEASQAEALARMQARVPFLAATSARFTGEMAEIAATFAAAGVTPDFHRGAEWLYALLATTPLAAETRATLPRERSLDDALAVFVATLEKVPGTNGVRHQGCQTP